MAYGMITSGILGAVAGLGEAAIKKVGDLSEAELKAKIDAEKEKRIEEAQIRLEDRAAGREQTIYDRNQADKVVQSANERQDKYDFEKWKVANDIEKQRLLNKLPPTESENLKNEQIRASINQSNQSGISSSIEAQSKQLDLAVKQNIIDAQTKLDSAKTPDDISAAQKELDSAKSKYQVLTGKRLDDKVKAITIPEPALDSTGNQIIDRNGKPLFNHVPALQNLDTGEVTTWKPVKEATPTYSSTEANTAAKSLTDQEPKPSWYEFGKKSERSDQTKKISERLQKTPMGESVPVETLLGENTPDNLKGKMVRNGLIVDEKPQQPAGMINKSTSNTQTNTDKAIEQTVKTATANPLIKFTDDPVKQGQYDTINGVILFSESSTQGADIGRPKPTKDNPHPTADGSYQLTNIAMKDLGIKPDLPNGEYSVASKERAAPQYYKKAYSDTQGDASAYLAYRFAPSDITNAVEKAKEKGGYWWQYAQSDYTKENMPTVVRDAKRTMLQLSRENKPVPTEIQRLILAYK